MYQVSNKVKRLTFGLIFIGAILFMIGCFLNYRSPNDHEILYIINQNEQNHDINSLTKRAQHQIYNRPWSAFYISTYLFFGIATTSLFFLSVQNVSQSGWSVVISRIIEAIMSFIPYGGVLIFVVIVSSLLNLNHLFHWMENGITDPKKENFDLLISLKSDFLNKPFFFFRTIFYVIGFSFFSFYIKKKTKKLDNKSTKKNYWRMYKISVFAIVFFGFFSMAYAWDFIMSIDPHWYSTLLGWYLMTSHLTSAIACIILVSVFLKNSGYLPLFNDNHLHDLAKYLFGFSLLWTYLWFTQFMLYWYANIPEEVVYFLDRFRLYKLTFFTMLIPNFLIPLFVLLSSSIKRNTRLVSIVAIIVILGHWLDYFNAVMPGTVGPFWGIGLLEIGSFTFILGLFIFIVTNKLSKINLEPKGNPLFDESKLYKYPH